MKLTYSRLQHWAFIAFIYLLFVTTACEQKNENAEQNTQTNSTITLNENDIEGTVVALIDQNEFSRALDWLASMDSSKVEVINALQRVHLNYGLGLMNMTVTTMAQGQRPEGGMNTNMYSAMRQFLKAYHLNPTSEAASVSRTQLQTIMSVYSTMPDRLDAVPQGIRDSLRIIGFNL